MATASAHPLETVPRDPGAFRRPAASMALLALAATLVVGAAAGFAWWSGLVALVACAIGLGVLQRPDWGAYALVAVVPAVAGLARGYPVPGLRVSELLIGALAVLILATADGAAAVPWRAFDWLAFAYAVAHAGIGLATMLGRGDSPTLDEVGTLASPFQFFLLYRAAVVALPEPKQRSTALRLVLLGTLPVAALAVLQQLDVAGVRGWLETATGTSIFSVSASEGVPRATGPYSQAHSLGGYLMLVLLLGVGLLLEGSGRVMRRRGLLAVLALTGAALAYTVTLAPLFGCVAGVLLLARWSRRLGGALLGVLLAGAVLALAFAPSLEGRFAQQYARPPGAAETSELVPNTIRYRWEVWTEQYLPVLEGRWLHGYGPSLPPGPDWQYTESLYVSLVLRGGLPLLLLYGGLVWALWALALRAERSSGDPDARAVGRVLVVALAALAVMHFVQAYFLQTGPSHLLWGLAAVAAAAVAGDDRRRRIARSQAQRAQ